MHRQDLERLTREQLVAQAEQLGIPRPRVLTQPELVDEIIGRTTKNDRERAKARGWLGRARDLLASVVERGLHLPEAARVLRPPKKEGEDWPVPPPPLPTVTLAEIYAAQGHLERAIAVLDEVIAREPDHREARAMRERFTEQSHRARSRAARVAPVAPPKPAATVGEPSPEVVRAATPQPQPQSQPQRSPSEAPSEASPEAPRTPEPEAAPVTITSAPPAVAVQAAPPPVEEQPTSSTSELEGATTDPAPVVIASAPAAAEAPSAVPVEAAPERPTVIVAAVTSPEPGLRAPLNVEVQGEAASEATSVTPEHAAEAATREVLSLEEPPLPERYEVDEIVAIAVDPRTVYLYWEVRATTLAHARAGQPDGWLCVRIATVTASWEGPVVDTRDLHVDALYGDRFLRDLQPGSNVRVSVGWRSDAGFQPFAVGSEVTAPRAVPVDSIAREVARWEAAPTIGPFPSRRIEAVSLAPALQPAAPAPARQAATAAASAAAFVERTRAASGAHGAPVDTGIAVWGAPLGDALRAGEEAYEEEYDEEPLAEDGPGWFEPGGSSELGRGAPTRRLRPARGRRLVSGVPGAPPGPLGWWPVVSDLTGLGGASELSPGGASELSY